MKKMDPTPKTKKENRLEKVIVFMLVVLISLLSFSVGVISGKGLSDKQFALKSLDKNHEVALSGEDFKEENDDDLSEEEIQQLANAALQAAEKDGDSTEVAATTKAPASVAKTDTKKADTSKITPAVKTASTPATDEARQPTSVKKAAPMNLDYTVQVASYPTLNDAEMMSTTLVKKGFPAFPIKVSIKGQDWYRVSVGSFKTKKEAMDYQDDLKKQGVVKDAVVQKLTK